MSKKKFLFKFVYDAPVTLTFSIIALVLLLIDTLVFKYPKIAVFLLSPTSAAGERAFSFSSGSSIAAVLLHIFSYKSFPVLLCDLIFILLLGPEIEEKYGSIIIGIMIFVASLFSGVLTACFCKYPNGGAACVVFMLILLDALQKLSRKKLSATSIAVVLLFIIREICNKGQNGIIDVIIVVAGGLCGSLFAFLSSPKARKTRKTQASYVPVEDFSDEESSGFRKRGKKAFKEGKKEKASDKDSSSEETVVGTLEL